MTAIGSHHQPIRGRTDDWLTPPWLIEGLGPFDTDPCGCTEAPDSHRCATTVYTLPQNGLNLPWHGMVWLNPPYGPKAGRWLARLAEHGSGIALIFARTETAWFNAQVWQKAQALLFIVGRLTFCRPDGTPASHNSGGPSVLVAYGSEAAQRLHNAAYCKLGAFVNVYKG